MNWCVESEVLTANPASRLRVPRPETADHIYLNHNDVDALAKSAFDVTGSATDSTLIHLLAYTGLRINEALALRVRSIDVARGRIQVKDGWTIGADGKPQLGTPKSGKTRTVGAPRFIWVLLGELISHRPADAFVFQAPRGGPMSAHNWRTRVFNLARDLAGLEAALTPHKLRHTAASMAIAAGADVKLVQQMLGHADATETLNTYSHLWPDRIDEISTKLDAARDAALALSLDINVPEMSQIAEIPA
jgi:integrase